MRDQDPGKAGKKSEVRSAPAARSGAAQSTDPTGILTLQRSIGNAAVVQLLAAAGDEYSQERHSHGPGCGHGGVGGVGGPGGSGGSGGLAVGGGVAPVQRSEVQSVLSSPGQPLAGPVRAEMETRLGADFADVRLHTGGAARRSAAEIGARAYTSGSHVVIGDGGADKHTLAHELTHVIQQRSGPVAGADNGSGLKVSDPSDRFEREAEANATRALGAPLTTAPTQTDAGAGGADTPGSVQRAVVPSTPGAPAATDQIQRAGGTSLLERGKAAVKKGAHTADSAADKSASRSAPVADFMAGGFNAGGNTAGDFGIASGIGAAAIVGGVLATPDMASSLLVVCHRFSAWRHAPEGEEKTKARNKLLKALADTTSNGSAVSGGVATGVGTVTGAVGPGIAGGSLGVFTGLYTAITKAVSAYKTHEKKEALKKADFPEKDFRKLLKEFQDLSKRLDENHVQQVANLKEQFELENRQLQQLPSAARRVKEAALTARQNDRLADCDSRYALSKTTVQDSIAECAEAANLQGAKELGVRKSDRKTVRDLLGALGGTMGISAGALSIVAVALGLTAGAIPIAGWAIAAVAGMVAAGTLTWIFVNKVRANLKAMSSDPAFKDHSGWGLFYEAMKVWKPKAESSRDRAAATLFEGLSSQYSENKAGAEALVKALSLDPEQLLKMPEAKDAIAKIKGRLAST